MCSIKFVVVEYFLHCLGAVASSIRLYLGEEGSSIGISRGGGIGQYGQLVDNKVMSIFVQCSVILTFGKLSGKVLFYTVYTMYNSYERVLYGKKNQVLWLNLLFTI